jgi:hypothetical protein
MLEVSLQRGDFHIPLVEIRHHHFALKKRQSYLDLSEILEEWARENLILTDEEYSNMNDRKVQKYGLSISHLTDIHQEILNESRFKDMDIQSMYYFHI